MNRPRLNMNFLENKYKNIFDSLNKNEMFVCQFEDGTSVFVEKIKDNLLDCIMVNPKSYKVNGFTAWQMPLEKFKEMYLEVLKSEGKNFVSIDKQNLKIRDIFESVLDALMCFKTGKSYNGYKLRQLD